MAGHWNSEGGQWKWVAAHWELPPSRSAVWVGGHWVPQGGSWAWVNGAWNVTDTAQSQAGPPQPPAAGVPTPSTPAPTIDGAYAPGGVVRAIDQPPVTTDYGPVEYSTPYPDYGYLPYYGWDWGFYPGAFIDWGPGFYGWGGYGFAGYGGWGRGGGHYGRGDVGRGGFAGARGAAGHAGGGRIR